MQSPRMSFLIALVSLAVSGSVFAQHAVSHRASMTAQGGEVNGSSSTPAVSGDGARVAFESGADNLVPGDTNGVRDIFLRERSDGQVVRVSVATGGAQASAVSYSPALSANGRFVAFASNADNLVPGDTNNAGDVFLHDTVTGETRRVSVGSQGQEGNDGSSLSRPWALSADGRFVAFESDADNLVAGDFNGERDVFVHDTQSGSTVRISVGSLGQESNGDSARGCLSGDGSCAIFDSSATNLAGGAVAGKRGVYFRDLLSGQTLLVSMADQDSLVEHLSMDGRYVVFRSSDGFNPGNIYVFDRQDNLTYTIGQGLPGSGSSQPNGPCFSASISADGRFVVFGSYAGNLVFPDFNDVADVFFVDRSTSTTSMVNWGFLGDQVNKVCLTPLFSADGSTVAYATHADNVVPYDQNGAQDIFVIVLSGCGPTVASYCVPSSTSIPGCEASLNGTGIPSLSNASAFTIAAGPLPGAVSGLIFWGVQGPRDQVFGTQGGRICVATPVARTIVQYSGGSSGACNGAIDLTLHELLSIDPYLVKAGFTIHAQAWFRDPPSPDGFGLSSGLWFEVCP